MHRVFLLPILSLLASPPASAGGGGTPEPLLHINDAGYYERPGLNVMVFVHSSGRVVIGKGYDLAKQKEMPVPSSLYRQLTNDSFLFNYPDTHSVKTGIVSLPEGPLLVSALPILTSPGILRFGNITA